MSYISNNRKFFTLFKKTIFSCCVDYNKPNTPIRIGRIFKKLCGSLGACFIVKKEKRKEFRRNINYTFIPNRHLVIDSKHIRKEPIEPWAFIRVRNEIVSIDTCLNSILPIFKHGVIAYNNCTDGTEEYVEAFCKLHPQFIPYKYPYDTFSLSDSRNGDKQYINNHLNTLYNKTLEKIPQDEWFMKVDIDQIYVADKILDMFYLPTSKNNSVVFGRLNLHYDGEKLYFIKDYPYTIAADHFITYNKNLFFSFNFNKKNNMYVEHLNLSCNDIIYTEVNNFHFPFIKKYRFVPENNLIEFEEAINSDYLNNFVKNRKQYFYCDKELLNKDYIMNICKKFNMNTERILPK